MCPVEDRGLDELVLDEAIDCQVIELLRDEVLPHSSEIPQKFILNVVVLLNKGSIHSATNANIGCDAELKLREEFAKTCFETLLQFSLLDEYCIDRIIRVNHPFPQGKGLVREDGLNS